MLRSINPYDQRLLAEYPEHDSKAIDLRIGTASRCFKSWKGLPFSVRSDYMANAAKMLRRDISKLARLITMEMGKTLAESRAEVEKSANACDFFAAQAERFLADREVPTDASKSFIAFQPLGPVLAIMPWNFPFWQVFRFAAPTLMAGNVGLLKHASNVSGSSLAIEQIFREAGFPEGVFQSLLIDPGEVGRVIQSDEIAAVTITGSEYAGSKVAAEAGRNLKKSVLELGGSDPFIVLEDADLELAAKVAVQSRMQNAGQSCIAAKRFIVLKPVRDAFIEKFRVRIEAIVQGDPMDVKTDMGPVARLDLAENLEQQLAASLRSGARLLSGGKRSACNFQPTLIDHVVPGNPAFDEEVFGPIASIVTASSEEEAVSLANRSRFGLGGSVWTQDLQKGEHLARRVESGCVFVNSLMRSDQRLPFGGIKKSGYGRELSEIGIKEFTNAKTIFIARDGQDNGAPLSE